MRLDGRPHPLQEEGEGVQDLHLGVTCGDIKEELEEKTGCI